MIKKKIEFVTKMKNSFSMIYTNSLCESKSKSILKLKKIQIHKHFSKNKIEKNIDESASCFHHDIKNEKLRHSNRSNSIKTKINQNSKRSNNDNKKKTQHQQIEFQQSRMRSIEQ